MLLITIHSKHGLLKHDFGQIKKCLVSGNPTDPTFLRPTLKFFGISENFSSVYGVF